MTTGYNIREGSEELTRRMHLVTDHDRAVAAAVIANHRRRRVARLARLALDILATPTPRGGMTRKPW